MNKEELVNLNLKDIIISKWKSKIGYSFNFKDLEELENIINYYEQENQQLKENLEKQNIKAINYCYENILLKKKWDKLKSWLEAMKTIYEDEYKDIDTAEHYNSVLSKLNELEEGKNDN